MEAQDRRFGNSSCRNLLQVDIERHECHLVESFRRSHKSWRASFAIVAGRTFRLPRRKLSSRRCLKHEIRCYKHTFFPPQSNTVSGDESNKMKMMASEYPSLILFGPLTSTRPTKAKLDNIQEYLRLCPYTTPITQALANLDATWQNLCLSIPGIEAADGRAASEFLMSNLADVGSGRRPYPEEHDCNAVLLPLNVITSVLRYLSFCQENKVSHAQLARDVRRGGGFQGCCAGLLPALAVANSETEAEIGTWTGRMVHLAFTIGAWVDADDATKRQSGHETTTLAIRWKSQDDVRALEKVLEAYDDAYLAVVRDPAAVVVPCHSRDDLVMTLAAQGMDAIDTGLGGRYHTADNVNAANEILRALYPGPFIASSGSVRSNATSEVFIDGDVTSAALRCILSERAEWHSTVMKASSFLDGVPDAHILAIGADTIPFDIGKRYRTSLLHANDMLPTPAADPADPADSADPADPAHTARPAIPDEDYKYPEHAIAVVGMACKFPGADSPDDFWDLLVQGRSMLGQMPKERFDPDSNTKHPRATKDMKFWGNFLDDVESFDHKFFRKSSREAMSMDPQQRILLQVAYEALQSAAYFSDLPTRDRSVGCYIGACSTDYDANVASHPPSAYATTGTLRAFLSGKISHHFGFLGPSLTFDTACSSSAVSVHAACQALQLGEVSSALAGGVTINTSPYLYENLAAAHFLSPTGATKPFDANADGYCRGEGAGIVVLKRLKDAVEKGDHIHGVIVSSAVNQNNSCVPITVPHSPSQAQLYQTAAAKGGLRPSDMAFVEAHGTGTRVGDPIELESIQSVFATETRTKPLYVTSVKGNIGHLEGASGIAALIKALLQFRHRMVPAQASFDTLNPAITVDGSKMVIPTQNVALGDGRLTACVNNYGAAGSNATLMLAEGPMPSSHEHRRGHSQHTGTDKTSLIHLTGASVASLEEYCRVLSAWLGKPANRELDLEDVAFSLARQCNQDQELAYGLTIKAASMQDLQQQLSNPEQIRASIQYRPQTQPVVLCFGGQASDRVVLDRAIWKTLSDLRFHLDQCDAALQIQGFASIYPAIFEDQAIEDVVVLHSALFALQYATAMAWIDAGLSVDAVIGHSFGQLTALAVCRSLSLADAVRLVAGRAALIKKHWGDERGVMIAVEGEQNPAMDLGTADDGSVTLDMEIACYNGPTSHVIVTDETSAVELEARLGMRSVESASPVRQKRLNVPYGFHSRFTEPLLPDLLRLANSLRFHPPLIRLEPCSDDASAWAPPSPQDIVRHTRKPVHFASAVQRLRARLGSCVWLEAGSHSGITALVRRSVTSSASGSRPDNEADAKADRFFPSHLGHGAFQHVVDTTASLWSHGVRVNFWFHHGRARAAHRALALPTYAWEKSRHWLPLRLRDEAECGEKERQQSDHREIAPPALLTLLARTPEHGDEHLFSVAPSSDEYQKLVQGFHSDSALAAPMTLLLQILIRAWPLIHIDIDPGKLMLQDVVVHNAGAGLPADATITLRLKPVTSGWTFVFTTSDGLAERECCTGVVEDLSSSSRAVSADFARYQRLVGLEVADDLASSHQSDCLRGKVVYSMFSHFGHYPKHYQTVQSVAACDNKIAGHLLRRADIACPEVHMLECYLQVAAIDANCLQPHDTPVSHFQLRDIERVQWAPSMSIESDDSEWHVICVADAASGKGDLVSYDLFVYNVTNGSLGGLMLGVTFINTVKEVAGHVHSVTLGTTRSTADLGSSSTPQLKEALQSTPDTTADFSSSSTIDLTEASHSAPDTAADLNSSSAVCSTEASDSAPALQTRQSEQDFTPGQDGKKTSIYLDLCGLLEKTADVPAHDVAWDATFDNLGVDSLMMMEVIRDVSQTFSVNLPIGDLEQLTDINSLVEYLQSRGCVGSAYDPKASTSTTHLGLPTNSSPTTSNGADSGSASIMASPIFTPSSTSSVDGATEGESRIHTDQHAAQIFDDMRGNVQRYVGETGFAGFWADVYPAQRDLVTSYIIVCFRKLGCDLAQIPSGQALSDLDVAAKYDGLVDRLHAILEDSGLVERRKSDKGCLIWTRSTKPIGGPESDVLFRRMMDTFPQHASETQLLNITASRLKECMTGEDNPLTLLFANQANRQVLADVYDTAPMCLATTCFLAEFVHRTLQSSQHGAAARKTQILEIGAGTGGTARYVVEYLSEHGIEFEYYFTDISPALVSQAKKKFGRYTQMRFGVIDCEKPISDEFHGRFDIVIATNCVHATDSAPRTASNILSTLTEHGVFCMAEFTRPIYWFDLVYGLLDGWWLFSDGRKHALADERFWHASLTNAGFQHVSWTDGESMEARTMRLFVATKHPHPSLSVLSSPVAVKRAGIPMQEVVWSNRAGVDLSADIYLPKAADPAHQKRPVALMFHGGGHLLFGRKDIPMKHVRELLKRGFLPVSVDYRLCPEVGLYEGPYSDCCDALRWAREELPRGVVLADSSVTIDDSRLISVGWSSGGQLAMSIGYTAPQRGIKPPDAIFALYTPSDLEHEHWDKPCFPNAAEENAQEVSDFLAGVENHQIVEYAPLIQPRTPSLSLTLADARARIVLHMNWKAQSVPILIHGLPNRSQLSGPADESSDEDSWKYLPAPSPAQIHQVSPLRQIRNGTYKVPTFLVHGDRDDWIPASMSITAKEELIKRGAPVELIVPDQCGHAFDMFPAEDPLGVGWQAVMQGYDWICGIVKM